MGSVHEMSLYRPFYRESKTGFSSIYSENDVPDAHYRYEIMIDSGRICLTRFDW